MNFPGAVIRWLASLVCVYGLPAMLGVPSEVHAASYELQVAPHRGELPIAVAIPESWSVDESVSWQLIEEANGRSIPVQFGALPSADGTCAGPRRRLLAVIPPALADEDPRRFRLAPASEPAPDRFSFSDITPASVQLYEADRPVLVYNHGVITRDDLPEREHRRSRSCYIHPLYGMSGESLTDDFPADHYHHHGVFWTWPHVLIDGQPHDLWAGASIRQSFRRFLVREVGPVAAVLAVENDWLVGTEQVLTERIWIVVFRAGDDERAVDLQMCFTPLTSMALQGAEEKSYGGLTVRFAPQSREESLITVPSGPTTDDLPDTPLAWADFTSRFAPLQHRSGAAIFVSPLHPDFPPTWLTRYYGPLCVGWPGVNARQFAPHETFQLDYRLWMHRGPGEFESLRNAYAGYERAVRAEWVTATQATEK